MDAPKGLRLLAAAAAAVLALAAPAAHAQADDLHAQALHALRDVETAIAQLDAASRVTGADPAPYKQAAQRAANALAGAASSGDADSALTHLGWLAAHGGTSVWAPAVQGALVNVKVANAQLDAAAKADELEAFWQHTSAALQALLVAAGEESRLGVLGGLRGAIATTDLGVPAHARIVSGCAAPPEAPAYGVARGYLVYVAVPSDGGSTRLPEALGIREVSAQGGVVIMRTAASDLVASICSHAQAAAPVLVASRSDDAAPAGLYTKQQAQDGRQVYAQHCANCHGNQLQGTSAPAAGGTAFLNKAKVLGWSVADMRNLVVTSMPRDNPGSLSPAQYADVLAYLLASDCYPAGQRQFPTTATPDLKGAELHPLSSAGGQDKTSGTCSLGR